MNRCSQTNPRLLLQPVAPFPCGACAPAVCREDLCAALPWAQEKGLPQPLPNLIPKSPPEVLTAVPKARALGCTAFLAGPSAAFCCDPQRERRRRGRRRFQGRQDPWPRGCHVSCRRWSGSSRVPPSRVPGRPENALDPVSAVSMAPGPLPPALSLVS